MKKLILNEEEKSTILEMHKSMGYKSMVSETMDLSDAKIEGELEKIKSELNIPDEVMDRALSCGMPEEVSKLENGKWENVLNNVTVQQLKDAYKQVKNAYKEFIGKLKDKEVNEQVETASIIIGGTTISLPMVMLGLLALGILTALITKLTGTKRTGYKPRRSSKCGKPLKILGF